MVLPRNNYESENYLHFKAATPLAFRLTLKTFKTKTTRHYKFTNLMWISISSVEPTGIVSLQIISKA